MSISAIYVGCGKFSLQRLEILVNGNQFDPIACVDINEKKTKSDLLLFEKNNNISNSLSNNLYTTISEAKKRHKAQVCFIFTPANTHADLIIESLKLGMHTFCVKPIAISKIEFKNIIKAYNTNPNLMLLQGYNNQWNEAALKMREWMENENGIGKMLGGECMCWGRQNKTSFSTIMDQTDINTEGMYFHTLACHQLSQLVAAKGLPEYVTTYVQNRVDKELNYNGIWGSSGGQCLFEYPDKVPFSYIGTRAGHGNPFGFASRWSGNWMIHGENGDIKREGGRLTLYQNGNSVEDYFLKDIDSNLIKDDEIQFKAFYEALIDGKNRKWLQQSSLDTWILMEACNESAKKNEKISINQFKQSLID